MEPFDLAGDVEVISADRPSCASEIKPTPVGLRVPLFALDWMQNMELRRRVQVGLNKGEARNALARAAFLYRLGEVRDRSFENQRYRACGLNLVVAAIILWNTTYLGRVIQALRSAGQNIDEKLFPHLSPLGWGHINLTGDYTWQQHKLVEQGKFRPLSKIADTVI